MTELVQVTLENEMDLILAYKRSIMTADLLGLTPATQTAFATAVSEVSREIIDKTLNGKLLLGVRADLTRFFMVAKISARSKDLFDGRNEGLEFARKLVPAVDFRQSGTDLLIELSLSIPRALGLTAKKVTEVKRDIEIKGPVSAYEEVKQKNAQLAGLNEQKEFDLIQANRLNQQKNEFLSVASHELNSPLTILRSYSQFALKLSDNANPQLKECLVKIENQSHKLVRLVKQLMDISKFEHGNISYDLQRIEVNSFLSDTLEALRLMVPLHQVDLQLGQECFILADPLRLEQVLNNLIGNAAKYSPAGSPINVYTQLKNDMLILSVLDHGIGMSEASRRRVFEKFYRDSAVEKKYSGLGMGLYIASRIIADHQGHIHVKSEEGTGSEFSVQLPILAV